MQISLDFGRPTADLTADLRHLYWRLRACRKLNQRRAIYYRIAREKKRLLAAGVPQIELHLICRVLASRSNDRAQARLDRYYADVRAGASPWIELKP